MKSRLLEPMITKWKKNRVISLNRSSLLYFRNNIIIVCFVAFFLILAITTPAFFSFRNLLNILDQAAVVGVTACGMTMVIITGGFDLSVAHIYGITGVVAAVIANQVNPVLGLLTGVFVGLILGLINGGVITLLNINTFIATLATGYLILGVASVATSGLLISVANNQFAILGQSEFLSAKYSVYVLLAWILICSFLLHRTIFGRYVYAVGGNIEATRLSGVRVGLIRAIAFGLSGLSAGIAGVIGASRVASASASYGAGLELSAIAAVVIGGTSILGGEGAVWRSIVGVLLLRLMINGFDILGIDPFYQLIFQGAIIIVAVAIDTLAGKER